MGRMPKDIIIDNVELMNEWDFEKNDPRGFDPIKIGTSSHYKVWWKCQEGHSWQAIVSNRTRHGRGCPYCSHQLPIKGETDLATCYPELAKEWHPSKNDQKPDEVMPGTHKKAWWICSQGHEWQAEIKSRTTGVGCPYCAGKKVLKGFNDLATLNPDLSAEWHPTKNEELTPEEVTVSSGKKVWWLCKNKHEYTASVDSRNLGTGCPICFKAMRSSFPEQAVFYFIIIKALMDDSEIDSIVCATDAGREGELIFRYIYQVAGCTKPVERLWISSLTYSAIKKGFENLKSSSEYDDLYQSARCRSEADWLIGMNGSRAFAVANEKHGLSVGRVQSPTLAILVNREPERRNFIPDEYCELVIMFDGWEGRMINQERADDPETWSRFSLERKADLRKIAEGNPKEARVAFVDSIEEG